MLPAGPVGLPRVTAEAESWATRIRTWTNRVKVCCAAFTPPPNEGLCRSGCGKQSSREACAGSFCLDEPRRGRVRRTNGPTSCRRREASNAVRRRGPRKGTSEGRGTDPAVRNVDISPCPIPGWNSDAPWPRMLPFRAASRRSTPVRALVDSILFAIARIAAGSGEADGRVEGGGRQTERTGEEL